MKAREVIQARSTLEAAKGFAQFLSQVRRVMRACATPHLCLDRVIHYVLYHLRAHYPNHGKAVSTTRAREGQLLA